MAEQGPTKEAQRGRSWLRGVLARFAGGPRRGDVIAANVEGGAKGVAVGKNIVQIGTLNLPVWPLLALLLALAAGVGAWALVQRSRHATMDGQFNIAVAKFVERDAQGRQRTSQRANEVGALVFNKLAESYPQPSPSLLLWRDGSVPWTRQGTSIGRIDDSSQAITIAQKINADIVIYGALDAQTDFSLQFYVSLRPEIYGDANALVGAYRFGDPIRLDPNDISHDSEALTNRAQALVALVRGLRADSRGDFNATQQAYKDAWALLPVGTNTAKAIVDYFKGHSFYYTSVLDRGADQKGELLDQADAAFADALRNDKTYARAQIGQGSVLFERAWRQSAAKRLQSHQLEAASDAYRRAIALAPSTSEPTYIVAVATQGLATVEYLRGGTLFQLKQYADADPVLANAATMIAQIRPTLAGNREFRLLAQSNQTLGAILLLQGTVAQRRGDRLAAQALFTRAADAYADCIAEGDAASDAALQVIVKSCTEARKQVASPVQPTQEKTP